MHPAAAPIVDTHIHFFRRGLPVVAQPRYLPDYDAEPDTYTALAAACGVTNAVIVQPSFYGTDNSHLVSLLKAQPDFFRGVAVVDPEIDSDALAAMARDGVTGIRLNLDGLPIPVFAQGPWPRLLRQLRELGWHVELHREAADLPLLLDPLIDAGVRIVVDHFGRPDAMARGADAGFRHLLRSARSGQVWVKLSAAYRNGPEGPAHAAALANELLQHFGPDRLVWGSDWPHTRHEHAASLAASLRALGEWVPDAHARARILGATALELFGFARTEATT